MRRTPAPAPRVALYSHDTQGLGHIRRNTLLAAALVHHLDARVLLLSGTDAARKLSLPAQTSLVTLPGIRKHADGRYSPRDGSGSLAAVVAARAYRADAELRRFRPDLLIVDKVARGIHGDLEPALTRLRAQQRTTVVLGLRDVLDSPLRAVREWRRTRTTGAIQTFYDAVWVYGDDNVYDPVTEYRLPAAVAAKTSYTGYLARRRDTYLPPREPAVPATGPGAAPYVLCLVGGGQDGTDLASAFAQAPLPPGHHGLLVTGPFLPEADRARVRRLAAASGRVTVTDFASDVIGLARGAAATVTMGGYNSICETLDAPGPVLVAPRTTPRREQAVRADRLAAAGLVEVLHGHPHPERIGAWLAQRVGVQRPPPQGVRLDGLRRAAALATELLHPIPHRSQEFADVAL